ncbi:MAG: hypothetical protein MUC90_04645, partial [Thermoplasmata archaeon]|nr:hypothetical protein [Thermoplasmata archaeon]
GVVIAFFLGFVDACNDSDLPGVPEIPSFMGSETEVWLSLTDTDVWGPLSAWWLLLVASVVQGAGLALALKFWKNEAV